MRVFKDRHKVGWLIARRKVSFHIERAALPEDVEEARAELRALLDEAEAPRALHDPETGHMIEPPAPLEPDPDLDEETELRPDFDSLADQASSEIAWLEATIPDIDTMTAAEVRGVVKRLARENLQTIRAWRYVIQKLGRAQNEGRED